MTPALLVNIDGTRVGRLWLDEKRQFCFCYDRGWLEPPSAARKDS